MLNPTRYARGCEITRRSPSSQELTRRAVRAFDILRHRTGTKYRVIEVANGHGAETKYALFCDCGTLGCEEAKAVRDVFPDEDPWPPKPGQSVSAVAA